VFYLLSLLLENHIPVHEALSRCVVLMGESRFGRALAAVRGDVASGVRFSRAFARHSLFSPYIAGWLSVADSSGDIAGACGHIASWVQKRDEARRALASRCLEPAVIVITGVYLLILIQAVVLPILTHAGAVV
jgi:type IV pilus assembly protein PilC